MEQKNYIVIELQTDDKGKTSNLVYAYGSEAEAQSKYYAVLSAAAISTVPYHAATLLNQNGEPIMWHGFDHTEKEE